MSTGFFKLDIETTECLRLTAVILAADSKDHSLREAFNRVLSCHFSTISIYDQKLNASCNTAEFVITDTGSYKNITTDNAVIIFKDTEQIDMELITRQPIIAIVDSCKRELLPFVSSTRLPAITCGLSPRDTVTLSSISEDSAVINLQRSIQCLDGTIAEPQEIPVRLRSRIDSFVLMAISTIFILSGNIDRLMHTDISD